VKLCVAVINSFLNEVHRKLPVKAITFSLYIRPNQDDPLLLSHYIP